MCEYLIVKMYANEAPSSALYAYHECGQRVEVLELVVVHKVIGQVEDISFLDGLALFLVIDACGGVLHIPVAISSGETLEEHSR